MTAMAEPGPSKLDLERNPNRRRTRRLLGYVVFLIAPSVFSLGVPFGIWIFFDAQHKNLSKRWVLPVVVMWYVFLPIYMVKRNNYIIAPPIFVFLAFVVVSSVVATHNHLNRKHGVDELTFFPSDSTPSRTPATIRVGGISLTRDPSWDNWVLKDSHRVVVTAHSMTVVSGHIGWRFLRWGIIKGDTNGTIGELWECLRDGLIILTI